MVHCDFGPSGIGIWGETRQSQDAPAGACIALLFVYREFMMTSYRPLASALRLAFHALDAGCGTL